MTLADLIPQETLTKLQDISTSIKKKEEEEIYRQHRGTHIFKSYEEALDFLVAHPFEYITWHSRTIDYRPDEKLFRSYEQDYSYDGVLCYDVCRRYTRQQLLDQIEEHIKYIEKKYGDISGFYDQDGYLEFVHI